MSQLSLAIFTTLAQSAVGMFIALGLVELLTKQKSLVMTRGFIAAIVLLGIGATASVTHLGQPFRMFNVAFGLAHGSALSLEIVGLSLFGGSAALYAGLRLFGFAEKWQKPLLAVSMVLGVVFVLAIANVYTLKTVPTWYTGFTPFQFLMTAACVGPIAAAFALRVQTPAEQVNAEKGLLVGALASAIIALAGYAAYLVWLGNLAIPANPFEAVGPAGTYVACRIGLALAGVLVWLTSYLNRASSSAVWLGVGTLLILGAEFIGRIFFYDAYIRASSGM